MYQPRRLSKFDSIPIRGIDYGVRTWGVPSQERPPLVMLHGWMDVAASFQFVVDAMRTDRWVLAPDWRGYGATAAPPTDTYWFADYIGDLDALIDHFAPCAEVDLVGHSMGGNIAMLYAGVRPGRVRRLVNLEGFGLAPSHPARAPARYAKWLDELRAFRRGEIGLRDYADAADVAARLVKTNPRLAMDQALWLAHEWASPAPDGRWRLRADPAHKLTGAHLYRSDEVDAVHAAIEADTLVVIAEDDSLEKWWGGRYTLGDFRTRLERIRNVREARVEDAGHMVHHDQPEAVAKLIEGHLDARPEP